MKTNKWAVLAITLTVLTPSMILTGCKDDARSLWDNGLKQCADNDLLGPDILYFGPSFSNGPGTVLVKYKSGGIGIDHLANEYLGAGLTINEAPFSCNVNYSKTNGISGSFDLSKALSIPLSLSAQFSKAHTFIVSSTNVQWVDLAIGKYQELVRTGLGGQPGILHDITNGQPVITRALQVSGLNATIQYASDVSADVQASLTSTLLTATNSDIGFSVNWQSSNTVVIAATGSFYIAGELHTWDNTVGGLAGVSIGPLVKGAGKLQFQRK